MQKVIALRAQNGQFVCAEGAGASALVANRNALGPWETFLMVDQGESKIALQACNGKYVGVRLGAQAELIATSDIVGSAESFTVIEQGRGKLALRHASGKYVAAEGGGGGPVLANRTAIGPWEVFDEVPAPGATTGFNPKLHGFQFANTFQVEPVNDLRFSGQCGGMAYAALDYYLTRVPVPQQDFRPAVRTPLFNYIHARQIKSTADNLDKWGELVFNPFGWRTSEFFNWGLQGFNGGRLQELRAEIAKGRPAPLGLFKAGNGGTGPHHQVLAIGYSLGRYTGDLGAHVEDLRIYIYDSNFPTKVMTLVPSPSDHSYFYAEDPHCRWMTYFVDRKYQVTQPPQLVTQENTDGLVRELMLEIRTGGDDLRGGNDNVHATVKFRDGTSQTFANINGLARWINNYTETVPLALSRAVPERDLASVVLTTTFGGGIGGDNWNMDGLRILANDHVLYERSGAPLSRFTGDNRPYTAELSMA